MAKTTLGGKGLFGLQILNHSPRRESSVGTQTGQEAGADSEVMEDAAYSGFVSHGFLSLFS